MRVLKNILRALALLAWSAVSVGQQPTPTPPAAGAETPPPAAGAERPSPPPPGREAGTPPPATPPSEASGDADEREFAPSEELPPDAAVTFPVNI
jgi:hypothetical protein